MTTYEERVSLLDFLHQKPGRNTPVWAEPPGNLESLILDAFNDLQRSKAELNEQVTALQARNKALEAYAHMVAHDLKDPLTVMVVTSDLIIKIPDLSRAELKEHLLQIGATALEMNRIINNLLLFAEVSQAEAPVGPVNMASVVANVQNRLSYMIKEKRAQIILPESWPGCMGYGPWLEEVWANYLSNAIKYGGRPPRVELGASTQPDGMLRFWMRDNGPGISPEALPRLFTPFNQIDSIRNPGHGLGLSMVLHIVEKLGGQAGVESEFGQGSLFYFDLPPGSVNLRPSAQDQIPEISHPT
jgi:signal transduction histidine kinase